MNENHALLAPTLNANLSIGVVKFTSEKGTNRINITGLPIGTKAVSAWITEYNEQIGMIAGHAEFYTRSVQLHANGQECRIIFDMLNYNKPLLAVVSLIYG